MQDWRFQRRKYRRNYSKFLVLFKVRDLPHTMQATQATPKYDLIKKRFMGATLTEESISPLLTALNKLGFKKGSNGGVSLGRTANNRREFDGYLTTIEFLENCMHNQKLAQQGSLVGSEAEFGTMPLASENNVLKNRQRSFDWNDARGAVSAFNAKTAASASNTIVMHVVVSGHENNIRRLKWLLKMRFFAEIGKVTKVLVVPNCALSEDVVVGNGRFHTGFAFVVFESEVIADAALAAAQHFPWPVSGRFNPESSAFEMMRYHRWQVEKLSDVEKTFTLSSAELLFAPVCANVSKENLLTTSEQLAWELRALQRSIKCDDRSGYHRTSHEGENENESENELLVHAPQLAEGGDESYPDSRSLNKDRKYSPGTKSRIAALLRKSIQEVRLASQQQADSPARNNTTTVDLGAGSDIARGDFPSSADQSAVSSPTERLLQRIQNEVDNIIIDSPISVSSATKKSLQHNEVEKHLKVSARTGDLYEVIGWYQEKIKLLHSVSAAARAGQNMMRNDHDRGSGRSRPTESVSWGRFQTFLDGLKADVRGCRVATKISISAMTEDAQGCARVVGALDALALLLLAEQMHHEQGTVKALRGTIHTQAELIAQAEQRSLGLSERLTDAREKVREYSHEIAELEQEKRILFDTSVRYELVRDQLFEAESLLTEQEQRLASRDNELRAAHASNALLRQTAEDLRTENARLVHAPQHLHQQVHHLQRAPHAPSSSTHARHSGYSHRSHYNNHVLSDSNSDADSEQESKVKAAQADRRTSTSARVASHQRRHAPSSADDSIIEPPLSLRAQVNQLACATTSDWIHLYLPRSSTVEELQATETELAGIQGDLTATLSKFELARKELLVCFHAKKSQFHEQEKEKQANQAADQNLCCICLENTKSVLLMPCRHLCVCQVCSEGPPESPTRGSRYSEAAHRRHIKSCPVCRAAVDECLKVFS